MITNERQYRITKAEIARFEEALAHADEDAADLSPRLRQAMHDQFASQLDDLRTEVEEYERLRSGRVAVIELESLVQLPDALIRARAAAGITQKMLADRLGLREQQIQRYEATHYAGAGWQRLQEVAAALGVTTRAEIILPSGGGDGGDHRGSNGVGPIPRSRDAPPPSGGAAPGAA
jgi:ribosome-binding protein aMBF1 (putative translation factor)